MPAMYLLVRYLYIGSYCNLNNDLTDKVLYRITYSFNAKTKSKDFKQLCISFLFQEGHEYLQTKLTELLSSYRVAVIHDVDKLQAQPAHVLQGILDNR